jgi:hypothetical protein
MWLRTVWRRLRDRVRHEPLTLNLPAPPAEFDIVQRPPDHNNVPGDFYVDANCCTLCGVPEYYAPDLFGSDEWGCWVRRQPVTPEEEKRMLIVMRTQDLGCIEYGGKDDRILRLLAAISKVDARRAETLRSYASRFDPALLQHVETADEISRLDSDPHGVFVRRLDDAKLALIAGHAPGVRHLLADGSNRVTDAGLVALSNLKQLETLDLEWSAVTDTGLPRIAAVQTLRWVDLGFCEGVSAEGIRDLRARRPDLEITETVGSDS